MGVATKASRKAAEAVDVGVAAAVGAVATKVLEAVKASMTVEAAVAVVAVVAGAVGQNSSWSCAALGEVPKSPVC